MGTSGNQITYTKVSGETPEINTSTVQSSWSGSGPVYTKSMSAAVMFQDNIALVRANSLACSDGNWFTSGTTTYYRPTSGTPSNHRVTSLADPGAAAALGFDLTNRRYITLSGLTFKNNGWALYANYMIATVSNISLIVTGCNFQYNANSIQITQGVTPDNNHSVTNCTFNYNMGAIKFYGGPHTNLTITDNIINNTGMIDGTNTWATAYTAEFDEEGIGLQATSNSTIARNSIVGGWCQGIFMYNWSGGSCNNNNIYSNIICNNRLRGFYIAGDGTFGFSGNKIYSNIFANCGTEIGVVIDWHQGSAANATNYFYNNTIAGGGKAGVGSLITFYNAVNQQIAVKNNIFTNWPYAATILNGTGMVFDYNCWYKATASREWCNGSWQTYSQWVAAGMDTHGIGATKNPLFFNSNC